MKKLIAILCTLVCILGLTACSQTPTGADKEKEIALQERVKALQEGELNDIVVNLMNEFTKDDTYNYFASQTNDEIEYIFETNIGLSVDGYGLKSAIESFHRAKDTVGTVQDLYDIKITVKGTQIIANAAAHCEKGDADVEMIFSNDLFMKIEGGALNPRATKAELMEKAAMNTLIGMGTVFAVLILISLIIACFGVIPKIQAAFAKKEEKEEVNNTGIENGVAQIAQQEEILEENDDTELVAVIAAAIAAYEGSTNTEGFVVRSIRRR